MNGTLFNILTWGVILASVVYWVVVLIRKKTRPQATKALEQMVHSTTRVMSAYLKWMLIWVVLVLLAAVGLILFFR